MCIYFQVKFGETVLICTFGIWTNSLKCSIKEGEDGATVRTWSVCTNASGGRRRCFQAYFVLSLYELLKPPLKSNWGTSATTAVLRNEPDEGMCLQHTRTRKTRKCSDECTAANWTWFSFSKDQLHLKKIQSSIFIQGFCLF